MAEPTPDTVFVKTDKGIEEIRSRTVKLPREAGLVFLSIDGKSSVADLLPRSGTSPPEFYRTLEMLVANGYIEAVPQPAAAAPAAKSSVTERRDQPAGAAPAALRFEDGGSAREEVNADRAAYDLLAESARARQVFAAGTIRAQAHVEHASNRAAHAPAPHREARRGRTWLIVLVLVILLPTVGALWLQFLPLTSYRSEAEQALSEYLGQPVKLSSVRYVLLPTPRIILQGLAIGPNAGLRADRIEAHVSPVALFASTKRLTMIEVKNAVIAPAMLATLPSWLNGRRASHIRVSTLQLSNLRIDVPAGVIAPFDGDVSFQPNGSVERVLLANDSLKVRLAPGAGGVVLKLDATAWTIPFGPPVPFSYFTANGRLSEREFAIDEFTGRIAGGYLQAKGTLRWPGSLLVNGAFTLQNVRLEEFLPALTHQLSAKGTFDATGSYEMRADTAEALLASTRVDAEFRVSRGELENLDLLRGFHTPGATGSRGGRTPFDKVTGTFHLSPGGYQYRQVRLSSGPFNASGTFEIARSGKLSGRVNAELVVGTHLAARSSFEVGGTASEPVLRR